MNISNEREVLKMTKYGESYTMTQEDLDIIATYMNDEIRESVHNDMIYNTPEEFLREYVALDQDFEDILKIEFSIEL